MKKVMGLMVVGFVAAGATAGTVLMRTDGGYTTTGERIEGTYESSLTTNVQEIAGLLITARTDASNHRINADNGSLGINNTSTNADEAARFETGETLILSFNKDIEITQLNFRYFDDGESFIIASSNQADFIIEYSSLSDKSSDFINTNLTVTADTEIRLYVITSGNIGIEGLDISVLGESGSPALSLEMSSSTASVSVGFNGPVPGSYVMQSCTNLASNVWNTVSTSFAADTNWVVETTNHAEFFRVIEL